MDPKSRSIDPDSNGRCGELKVLEDAKENSDSERLRFRTMVGVGGSWVGGGCAEGRGGRYSSRNLMRCYAM